MTLKASLYDQLSREELIRLLEARDNEPDNAEIYISSETPTIKASLFQMPSKSPIPRLSLPIVMYMLQDIV